MWTKEQTSVLNVLFFFFLNATTLPHVQSMLSLLYNSAIVFQTVWLLFEVHEGVWSHFNGTPLFLSVGGLP